MKQAVLHTGEVLHFPDETPDAHIDAAVQQKLGVPPPPDPAAEAHAQSMAAVQTTQQLAAQVSQSMAALMQQMGATVQALSAAAQAVTDGVQRMEAANQVLAHALTAPKVLTKDANGQFRVNVVK